MTRLDLLAATLALTACTVAEDGYVAAVPNAPAQPRIDQQGTCFALVTAQPDGTFTLTTGIGDGSRQPMGVPQAGLSAKAVDAALARERAIMEINPECLGIHVKPRPAAAQG
ncbi:MAG: hypothetical protein IE922_02180 [Sphingomonadales bacterium]|nr:hypothetical protein [Sphingomonadales bacterium]